MARLHLFELHDQGWFPAVWRELLTDYLAFYAEVFRPYRGAGPLLAEAMRQAGATRVVELCSGGGAAVPSLLPALDSPGSEPARVTLTDKFPNPAAWSRRAAAHGDRVEFSRTAVDATAVPKELTGFRTLFTSLHHLQPAKARAVLADAAAAGEGVAAFEYTERNLWVWGLPVLLIPLFLWVTTPFMRPFSWRRLLWTYLLPVVPLVAMWDGFVSCLRTYSVAELEDLVASLPENRHRWRVGRVRSLGISRMTYVIGVPCRAAADAPASSAIGAGAHAADALAAAGGPEAAEA